ncbi:MAG TPA: FAD-dependent oxidoreductase [Burkholderiales bacterium]|nr:FAD-dependent oxidoreductase [Burkholderiales bacterium]
MTRARLAIAALLLLAVAAFLVAGGPQYLSFANLQELRAAVERYYAAHRIETLLAYFFVYVLCTGLSLPGSATILTLIGGAVFGFVWGTVLVSFAASLGATLAFLLSRFILRDWVQQRFGGYLRAVNEGIEREGGFYLFTLRLIPYVPYFAINLVMGLTPMRAWTFYWVGQLGMLAGTMVYVNAGTQLSSIHSAAEIVSPRLVGAFLLLAFFPLLAKKLVDAVRAKRVYSRWTRPARFERNLVVIGAGSAGLVCAYIAATLRAKVTLVEKHRMGGDCLNTGCVPSKALLKSARVLAQMRRAAEFGLKSAHAEVDFAQVMERVQRVVAAVAPHDSAERYRSLGVECLQGEARIASPWSVEITSNGARRVVTTRSIIIAAGARPFVPPIPGIDKVEVLTSDNVWDLRELPRRLVVLGGGPVGCELAQAFARFGSQVTQIEMLPRLLAREDEEVSAALQSRFASEGVRVLTGHKATEVRVEGSRKWLVAQHAGAEVVVEFDALLCALGRQANTAGYGLEELGIPVTRSGTIATDDYLRTRYPNIYACGDAAGPYQFTHAASHQAWYATVNALLGAFRSFRADYSVIPWATFTEPEVARVGLNETDARQRNIRYEATVYRLDDLDRAIADGEAHGMVKVLTVPGGDRVLGATIVGEQAGELIGEFVLAMRHGLGLKKILGTIHVYPTLAEANKHAAGAWRRAHAPEGLLRKVERLQAWMRA